MPFHSINRHKGPTTPVYSRKKILGQKALCVGEGAGRQYSQSSEAKQLLESVTFNFIDLIMPQVSETTEFHRLISKSLVSKISLQRTSTDRLPALKGTRCDYQVTDLKVFVLLKEEHFNLYT